MIEKSSDIKDNDFMTPFKCIIISCLLYLFIILFLIGI